MALNIAIFFSGNGSNMLNILKACNSGNVKAKVCLLISNNPHSNGLKQLPQKQKNVFIFDYEKHKTKKKVEEKILKKLDEKNIQLICLAGYNKILSKDFIEKWKNKILNIHPSLLPAFKGLNAQKQAYEYGVKYTGCTVHIVDEKIDNGKILGQKLVEIDKNETVNSLTKKILIQEHKLYINVLKFIINRRKYE